MVMWRSGIHTWEEVPREQQWISGAGGGPVIMNNFFLGSAVPVPPWWNPTGSECERRLMQGSHPPQNKSSVKSLGGGAAALGFDTNFPDKHTGLLMARPMKEARVVSVYVKGRNFSLTCNIHADLFIYLKCRINRKTDIDKRVRPFIACCHDL